MECKVRDNDSSEKELHKCSYCGRGFCVKHFEPKLVHIPNLKAIVKDPVVSRALEEEAKIEGGHPDFQYAQKRFEDLKIEAEIQFKLRKAVLDRMMTVRPRQRRVLLGTCPKCFRSDRSGMIETTKYDAKTMTFTCLGCGHKWTQEKAPPHKIIVT